MTRRTYYRNQPEDDGEEPAAAPPPPPPSGGGWLRTGMTIALSAVVGAIAVDIYRRYFSKERNPEGGEESMSGFSPMGALPGAPSIMPMPMPLPLPYPMMMPNFGGYPQSPPVAPGYRDERPLTEHDKLELARLNTERAKAEADRARWEAWESGEID